MEQSHGSPWPKLVLNKCIQILVLKTTGLLLQSQFCLYWQSQDGSYSKVLNWLDCSWYISSLLFLYWCTVCFFMLFVCYGFSFLLFMFLGFVWRRKRGCEGGVGVGGGRCQKSFGLLVIWCLLTFAHDISLVIILHCEIAQVSCTLKNS